MLNEPRSLRYDNMPEMTHARITSSLFCRDAEIARDPVEFAFIKLRFLRATVSRVYVRITPITRNRLLAFFSPDGSNASKVIRFAL